MEALFAKKHPKRPSEAKIASDLEEQADESPASIDCVKEIQSLIDSNTIMVFSKTYCPFCRQAKMALRSVPNLEFHVVEMDDGSHDGWQGNVSKIAKSLAAQEAANNNTASVPQIFIKQQYIGGAEDLADMFADGRLAKMLGRPLYP